MVHAARLKTHKSRSRGLVKGGPELEAAYVVLPTEAGGKSAAKTVEALAIKNLTAQGLPMLSTSDSRNKRSPKLS